MSIPVPNYTPIPNVIIDYWMPRLSSVEFNVLLFICRKTFGWHKVRDRISLSQIVDALGSSRTRISEALKTLGALKLVKKITETIKGQPCNSFEVILSNNNDQCQNGTTPSTETVPTKETTQKKEALSGSKNKTYKRENRHIPEFLRIKGMHEEDWQKLANQFSEAHLVEALQEAKSYHKNIAKILNIPAYITAACKRYMEKGNGRKHN